MYSSKEEYIKNIKILLVEDEVNTLQLLQRIVKVHFKNTIIAVDGEDGYNKYKEFSPDIIITDIRMPNLDGLKMSGKIKKDNPNAKIIVMTAHKDLEYIQKALDIGITRYISKPLKSMVLFDYIQTIATNLYNQHILEKKSDELDEVYKELHLLQKENKKLNEILTTSKSSFHIDETLDTQYLTKLFETLARLTQSGLKLQNHKTKEIILSINTKKEQHTIKSIQIDENYTLDILAKEHTEDIEIFFKDIITIIRNKQKLRYVNNLLEDKINQKIEEQHILLSLFEKGESVLFKWNNDEHWSVAYVSSSVKKILGYEAEDFLSGKIQYRDCIHKDDIHRVEREVIEGSSSNKDFFKHKPYRIVTKDNDIKWIVDYTVSIKDDNDKVTYFVGYIHDITEEKLKDKMLTEQLKLASMGEMIGNISHQWRQPLSVISTGATGLLMQKEYGILTDEMLEKTCNAINTNAQYLSKTIDDFRNFIKDDRKKEKFTIKDNIDTFINLIDSSIKSNEINLMVNIKDENLMLDAYPNELIQCYMNLYNNSKDALNELEEPEKLIFIDIYTKGNKVVIEFKDNAGGIPEYILPKIFEPYFTTKHKSQGTGLGLHMTYNLIVNGMRGSLKATNINYQYNKKHYIGALFTITIPIK